MGYYTRKTTPETALKRACIQYLQAKYGRRFWYVNVIGGLGIRPGTPDTLACLDGRFIGMEFKNGAKGKLTENQETALRAIKEAGGVALVVRSIDGCIEHFKTFGSGNQSELF